MGYSQSIQSYEDVQQTLDKALQAERGLKINCKDNGAAFALRHRFNAFRKADRREQKKLYPEGDPRGSSSAYDKLILRIPRKGDVEDNCLFIEKTSSDLLNIEEL